MFWHIFTYRIKSTVRNYQVLFWTLGFPVILATFFGMAFANIGAATEFETIKMGIVNTAEYKADTNFQTHLKEASDASDDPMFELTVFDTQEDAANALREKTISGYILEKDSMQLYIRSAGIQPTIMKTFIDWYMQTVSAINGIIADHPESAMKIPGILEKSITYVEDVNTNPNKPNSMLTYYYALMAMTCLYGAFMGLTEVGAVQANQSATAARVNLAPVHKMKVFACSLCSATLIQYLSILILIAYLIFVQKVDFGNQAGFILLASFAGCCTGVSFGALIGAIVKKGEGIKTGVLIGSSMLMSFLAGLMNAKIKYTATKSLPILAYINPGNLIADAFYSLYYYETYNRYLLNVGLLFAFSFVFYFITYLIMRRQQYESL